MCLWFRTRARIAAVDNIGIFIIHVIKPLNYIEKKNIVTSKLKSYSPHLIHPNEQC